MPVTKSCAIKPVANTQRPGLHAAREFDLSRAEFDGQQRLRSRALRSCQAWSRSHFPIIGTLALPQAGDARGASLRGLCALARVVQRGAAIRSGTGSCKLWMCISGAVTIMMRGSNAA